MSATKVTAVYFSPTGATRRLVTSCAKELAEKLELPLAKIDFTLPRAREHGYSFTSDDLVVFGTPTYAGKVPNKLLPFVQEGFEGGGAHAVAIVAFGNRAFDNSLAELVASLSGNNFRIIGAGAFACRHAFSQELAAGRPDEEDLGKLSELASTVVERIQISSNNSADSSFTPVEVPGHADAPYYTPLGLDGQPTKFLAAKPKTHADFCDHCGVCAKLCPMAAISFENYIDVPGTCIKCHSCVRNCPQQAKYFDNEAFLSHRGMLERDYTRRAESVWFV